MNKKEHLDVILSSASSIYFILMDLRKRYSDRLRSINDSVNRPNLDPSCLVVEDSSDLSYLEGRIRGLFEAINQISEVVPYTDNPPAKLKIARLNQYLEARHKFLREYDYNKSTKFKFDYKAIGL